MSNISRMAVIGSPIRSVVIDSTSGVSATAWTPESLANLEAWYDATDASTFTLEQFGSLDSNWADKSGNTLDLTVNGFPPDLEADAFGAGLDGFNFDDNGRYMATASNPFGTNIDNAVFAAIIKTNALGSGRTLVTLTGNGNSNGEYWRLHAPWNSGDNSRWLVGDGASGVQAPLPNTITGAFDIGDIAIVVAHSSTAQDLMKYRVNGTEYVSLTPGYGTGATVVDNIWIGNSGNTANSNDGRQTIGEILIGSGDAYTDADLAIIEGYLAHKFGQTALLPGGHPYKNTPP